MLAAIPDYPIRFDVERELGDRNRVTVAFRIILAIPILILLGTVSGGVISGAENNGAFTVAGAGGLLFAGPLLMILFRRKYPRWWFDWNIALWRFENRIAAYALLLRDEYPATDDEQAVRLEVEYPDVARELNRWLPLVKWLLVLPHVFVLVFVDIALFFVVVFAWFAILFTGSYPAGAQEFVIGVMRWHNRVIAYALTLVTDRYPPFRLAP
jgi:hypothetical protein